MKVSRRTTLGAGGALLALGAGVGLFAVSRREPLRFPPFGPDVPEVAREGLVRSVLRAEGTVPPSRRDLRARRGRALVLVAGRHYRLAGPGTWAPKFGRMEAGGIYVAPEDAAPRLWDVLEGDQGDGVFRNLFVRIVAAPDRPPRSEEPRLADARFSAHPPPVGAEPPSAPFTSFPLRLVASGGEPGGTGDPIPGLRALARGPKGFAIAIEGTVFRVVPVTRPDETVSLCAIGPTTEPPKGGVGGAPQLRVVSALAFVWQAAPSEVLQIPHPASVFIRARTGWKGSILPPRTYLGAYVRWRGLVLVDHWSPGSNGPVYAGTTAHDFGANGVKSSDRDLMRTSPRDRDGRPAGWFVRNRFQPARIETPSLGNETNVRAGSARRRGNEPSP